MENACYKFDMFLISKPSYTLYMAVMGILLALIAQLHRSLAGSLKWIRISATLLVINFGTGWWILLQTPTHHQHRPLIHVIFYGTMILSPLFLLYVLLQEPLVGIKNVLIGVFHRLRGQTNTDHNLPSNEQLEANPIQNPSNNTLSSSSSIETNESDHETGSSRVTSSVPRSGSNSSIGSHVEEDIQLNTDHNLPSNEQQLEANPIQNPSNNTLSSSSSIETNESDHETGSSRVTSSVPRSGSNSSIGSHVEEDIQVICT